MILLLGLLLGGGSSSVTWAATPWALSYEDALRGALGGNAELRSARESVEAAKAQEGVSFSPFFPSVSAGLNLNYGAGVGDDSRWSTSIAASQNLFSGNADTAKYQQAQYNTIAAQNGLRITQARVVAELKGAFAAWLYARRSKDLVDAIQKRRSENLRLVQLRFQSGLENKGSVLLSDAYLAQAKYDVSVAEDNQRVSDATFARAVGMESTTGEALTFNLQGDVPMNAPQETLPNFQDLARQVPEVMQAQAQTKAAEKAIIAARAKFFPTLDARGSMSSVGSGILPIERDGWSLGLSLSLPLFDGYRDTYAVRSAAASERVAESNQSSIYQDAVTRLSQAFANYREAVRKLAVDEKFQAAAALRAEIARKRYNNGLMSFEDWDQIENDLINRQKTYLISQRDRVNAEAAWEQALGGSL